MFNLPKSTKINKSIYKKIIYQKYSNELKGNKKESFDKEIKKITIIAEISESSINIKRTSEISSIFVLLIELKTKDFNKNNINLILRLFSQNLLIVLNYENEYKLAINKTKLLFSQWVKEEELNLSIIGYDLQSVWDNFVTQITKIEIQEGNTLEEQIEIEQRKEKLIKLIKATENKARKETQSKKKFELLQQKKAYEKELEEL